MVVVVLACACETFSRVDHFSILSCVLTPWKADTTGCFVVAGCNKGSPASGSEAIKFRLISSHSTIQSATLTAHSSHHERSPFQSPYLHTFPVSKPRTARPVQHEPALCTILLKTEAANHNRGVESPIECLLCSGSFRTRLDSEIYKFV
jgi:hypothetical protein